MARSLFRSRHAKHRLHPRIDRGYPFDQYQDALKQMQSGNFVGKLVIRF